ncbi:hypothetical protein [Streptomyces sp. NPDC054842]
MARPRIVTAGAVTRGHHLAAVPGKRVRVAADRLLEAALPRQGVQPAPARPWPVPPDASPPEPAPMPGGASATSDSRPIGDS